MCIFFFQEVFYENYLQSLLNVDVDVLYFLLIVKFLSCGELSVICQGVRGVVCLDIYCFLYLIVWFVCLVSFVMNIIDYVEICGVLFYVVSLQ